MYILKTTNIDTITSIITNPKLWALEYGQGHELSDFTVDPSFDYLLIKEGGQVMGLFQARGLTKIVYEAHIYLLPAYWGKKYAEKALDRLFEYAAVNTAYHKILTDVPINCNHVIGLMERIGATCCGLIKEGVIYDGVLQDLLLFDKKIERI